MQPPRELYLAVNWKIERRDFVGIFPWARPESKGVRQVPQFHVDIVARVTVKPIGRR
jgi:hypothetical protein